MSFEKLKLIEPILKALKSEGYTTPTPIQAQTIPLALERNDIYDVPKPGQEKLQLLQFLLFNYLLRIKT